MRGRYLVVLGVILVAGEVLVRVLVQQPASVYTTLDGVCDVAFVVGIACIIAGVFIGIFKKKAKKS